MPAQGSYMGACAGLKSAPCTTQVFNAKGQEVPLAVLFVSPPLPHSLHRGGSHVGAGTLDVCLPPLHWRMDGHRDFSLENIVSLRVSTVSPKPKS